jgi:hypothetical protein
VIVEALVTEPDRDRVESWELSDGRRSIHCCDGKERAREGIEWALLSPARCATQ